MLPKIFKGGTLLKTESGQKVPPPSTTSFQSPAQIGLIKFMYYNPSRIISNNNSKKLRFCTSLTDWLIFIMLSIANKIYEIISIIHFIVFPQTLNYTFAWYWIIMMSINYLTLSDPSFKNILQPYVLLSHYKCSAILIKVMSYEIGTLTASSQGQYLEFQLLINTIISKCLVLAV